MDYINYLAPISLYRSAHTTVCDNATLTDFMLLGKQYAPQQIAYRTLKASAAQETDPDQRKRIDDAAKRYKSENFPAATLSGLFDAHKRSKSTLIQHSGWMCIDIDDHFYSRDSSGAVREYTQSLEDVPAKLSKLPWVSYAAHSVGGVGYYALIPLAKMPIDGMSIIESHEWYFDCLVQEFAQMGVSIDPACRDVTRLRFCSYDPNPVVRRPPSQTQFYHGVAGFESRNERNARLAEESRRYAMAQRNASRAKSDQDWSLKNIDECCTKMERLGINLCESYDDWRSMGLSLAAHFGESGSSFFHRISRMSSKYNASNTDKFYASFLRTVSGSSSSGRSISILTAYKMFADAGISFMSNK